MGLDIYNSDQVKTSDAEGQIVTAHDGVSGESVETLVYLRNDDSNLYFTNIEIWPYDDTTPDDTLGVYGTGWGVKLSAGSRQPTPDEWENVLAGDTISMSDIGTTAGSDTSTYYPIWVKVTVPGNLSAQTKTTMRLRRRAVSHIVGS